MSAFAGLMLVGMVFGATPQVVWELIPDMGFTEKVHGICLSPDSESIVFTGESNQDIWVYKLSRDNGDSVWAHTYDNEGGEDIGYDVAVAPTGSIFVGATTKSVPDPKLFVCEYSSTGGLVWTQLLALVGPYGAPSVYCRDSDSCYIATWRRVADNTHAMVYLFKENGEYDLLWEVGTILPLELTGIDIDSEGQVYFSSSSVAGCWLRKSEADVETYIWNSNYEETGTGLKGWQCRVGPTQEIFFCGERTVETTDFLMLKWSPEGTLLWDPGKHYDLGHDEYCRDMWVDAISDCYLAGWQVKGTEEDAALVKTDSAGNMLWSWIYEMEGDQQIEAIEVDEEGYIYLAGSAHNGADWDMLVMQVAQPLTITGRVTDSMGVPMEDIQVVLSGDTTVEVYTDTSGYYGIEIYNGGTYTVSPNLPGWVFTPASYTYSPLAHREFDQNFSGEWTGVEENPHGLLPHWKLISSCGPQITLSYINYPDGFSADVFDAAGRQVDELHAPQSGGTVSWGMEHSPGVYFIVPQGGNLTAQKVVLVR